MHPALLNSLCMQAWCILSHTCVISHMWAEIVRFDLSTDLGKLPIYTLKSHLLLCRLPFRIDVVHICHYVASGFLSMYDGCFQCLWCSLIKKLWSASRKACSVGLHCSTMHLLGNVTLTNDSTSWNAAWRSCRTLHKVLPHCGSSTLYTRRQALFT